MSNTARMTPSELFNRYPEQTKSLGVTQVVAAAALTTFGYIVDRPGLLRGLRANIVNSGTAGSLVCAIYKNGVSIGTVTVANAAAAAASGNGSFTSEAAATVAVGDVLTIGVTTIPSSGSPAGITVGFSLADIRPEYGLRPGGG